MLKYALAALAPDAASRRIHLSAELFILQLRVLDAALQLERTGHFLHDRNDAGRHILIIQLEAAESTIKPPQQWCEEGGLPDLCHWDVRRDNISFRAAFKIPTLVTLCKSSKTRQWTGPWSSTHLIPI